jgi:hypothetical protein
VGIGLDSDKSEAQSHESTAVGNRDEQLYPLSPDQGGHGGNLWVIATSMALCMARYFREEEYNP